MNLSSRDGHTAAAPPNRRCYLVSLFSPATAKRTGRLKIAPVTFPEYAAQALPGSYIATRASSFRNNPAPAFHRFSHAGGPLIPDLDCLIWDYVLHSGERADHIILAEGDMLLRVWSQFGPCGRREYRAEGRAGEPGLVLV
jgi:hypothetical protein